MYNRCITGVSEGGLLLHAVSAKSTNMQCCRRRLRRPIYSAKKAVAAAKFTSPANVSVCIHSSCDCTSGTSRRCHRQQRATAACWRNRNGKDVGRAVLGRTHV